MALAALGMAFAIALIVWRPFGNRGTKDASDILQWLAATAAAVGATIAAHRSRGRTRAAWACLAAAQWSWSVGQAIFAYFGLVVGQSGSLQESATAVVAIFFIGWQPLMVAGLLTLFSAPGDRIGRARRILDASILALGLMYVAWEPLLLPTLQASAGVPFLQFISLFIPMGDLLVLALVAFALIGLRRPEPAMAWLAFGVLAVVAGDFVFSYAGLMGTYATGAASDLLWIAGFTAFALTAPRAAEHEYAKRSGGSGLLALLLPFVGLVPPLWWLGYDLVVQNEFEVLPVAGAILIVLLVSARQILYGWETLRTRRLLDASNHSLKDAQGLAHVGSWTANLTTQAAQWSEETFRIFGQDPASFVPTLESFLAQVHPDDRERVSGDIGRSMASPAPYSYDYRLLRPDGTTVYVHGENRIETDDKARPLFAHGTVQDVTTQMQAAQALQASEGRFRFLSDSAFEAILVHDGGRITDCNEAMCRLVGLPRDRILGEDLFAFVGRDSRDAVRQHIQTRNSDTYEAAILCSDGTMRAVEARGHNLDQGTARVVAIRDITERKAAERALRERERLLDETQTVAHVGSWELDLATGVQRGTDEQRRLFGLAPGEAETQETILAHIHPEDRQATIAALQAAVEVGQSQLTLRTVWADGSVHWIENRAESRRGDDGRAARLVGIAQDVTERRQREERLQSIMDSVDEVIVSTDFTGQSPPVISRAAERLYGRPAHDFIADPMLWTQYIHQEDRERVLWSFARLQAGEHTVNDTRIVRDDGTTRWVRVSMHPVSDAFGRVVRADGTIRDTTPEHEAAERKGKIAELEEVSAFKTRFLNNAAHELGTPLTPIKLQMASLREVLMVGANERQRKAVELLDRNLNRLGFLVQDLLEAARAQSGKIRVLAKPMDAARAVRDAQASFVEKAEEQGLDLRVELPTTALEMTSDDARIGQVLVNLLSNAMKFTPRGGHVVVAGRLEGSTVAIEVRDTGLGLMPEQMDRLFIPFSQVHDTQKLRVGGTGLGLYISRTIAAALGGTLTCESAGPGQGCVFTLKLPVAGPPVAVAAAAA